MKKHFTLILLLITSFAFSQTIFEKEIEHAIRFNVRQMATTSGGDYLFIADANPATYDSSIAMLIKTDSMLQLKWCKRYKLLHQDFFNCIVPLSDGNYLIGGAGKESFNQTSGGSLYKIDTAGTVLWHWIYSDAYDDAVLNAFEQPDNSLMIFIRDGVSNHPTKVVLAGSDGTFQSQRIFNFGNNNLFADAVTTDGAGNYLMAGTINNSVGTLVLYVISLNDTAVNWYKEFTFNRTLTCTDIKKLSDGNFAISGSMTDSIVTTTYNCYVLKINSTGDIIWSKEIKQTQAYNEYGLGISPLSNTEMILYGNASTANGFNANACKLNSSGDVIWSGAYGNYPYQAFNFAYPISDGRLLLEAFINSSNKSYFVLTDALGESPCNYFPVSFSSIGFGVIDSTHTITVGAPTINPVSPSFLISSEPVSVNTLCTATDAAHSFNQNTLLNLFPNPTNGNFIMEFSNESIAIVSVQIANVVGNNVFEMKPEKIENTNSMWMDTQLPAGIYLLKIQTMHSIETKKLIVIK